MPTALTIDDQTNQAVEQFYSLTEGCISEALTDVINSKACRRAAGTLVKLEGELSCSVFVMVSGWIALNKTLPDGEKQILDFLLPGEVVDPGSADPLTSALEVEAITDVELAVIPRRTWEQLLHAHEAIRTVQGRVAAAAQARMSERLLRMGKANAQVRVAYALLELFLRLKTGSAADGDQFHLPFTQQELGDFAGLSSVHVCRTLRRLKRHGIVETAGHMDVLICDVQALAEAAQVNLEELRNEIIPNQRAQAYASM
jgi:CRP/FNR family transcriptional regulator, anaerobic regulatory protein